MKSKEKYYERNPDKIGQIKEDGRFYTVTITNKQHPKIKIIHGQGWLTKDHDHARIMSLLAKICNKLEIDIYDD